MTLDNSDSFWEGVSSLKFQSEADVETMLIVPMMHVLGYNVTDIASKYPIVFQEGRKGRKPEADFVVFSEETHNKYTSLIVVEAKNPSEQLLDGKLQAESYTANIKAPVFILTNGVTFEIWQYQAIEEATQLICIPISEIKENRGKIESIISKIALMAHCKKLKHKSFGILSREIGEYESNEYDRCRSEKAIISRRLRAVRDNQKERLDEFISDGLLDAFPNGLVVTGASGLGKTTLLKELLLKTIEQRWKKEATKIPVEIFLPDLLNQKLSVFDFIKNRISSHSKNVTKSSLVDLIQSNGIVILCDGYDRVEASKRDEIESQISIFLRDFKNVQLFIFTRRSILPHRLRFSNLELLEFNDKEIIEFLELNLEEDNIHSHIIWNGTTNFIKEICQIPLILDRVCNHYKIYKSFPISILPIFDSWLKSILDELLTTQQRYIGKVFLKDLANQTINSPINEEAFFQLIQKLNVPDDLAQKLIDVDAIIIRGDTVDIAFDAMADYLRAIALLQKSNDELEAILKQMSFVNGSFLPTLLMACADSPCRQSIVWKNIASNDLVSAINTLRYRAETETYELSNSEESKPNTDFLSELLDAITFPSGKYFGAIKEKIYSELANDEVDTLGIVGRMDLINSNTDYSFINTFDGEATVTNGFIPNATNRRFVDLGMSGLRNDCGRLIGLKNLEESLLKVNKGRGFVGGNIWSEELAISRLKHLENKYDFPALVKEDILKIIDSLMPYRDKIVPKRNFERGQSFTINSLIYDLEKLLKTEKNRLDYKPLPPRMRTRVKPQDEKLIEEAIKRHFSRTQIAYKEIVEGTYPKLTKDLSFYQMLPVRYEVLVSRTKGDPIHEFSMQYKWVPVSSFSEQLVTIEFTKNSDNRSDFSDSKAHKEEILKALEKINRSVSALSFDINWSRLLPDFMGERGFYDSIPDETSIVGAVGKLVEHDINFIFKELPRI